MENQKVAKIFEEIADLLEIKGENPFRIRAYRKAAMNIEALTEDISDLIEDKRLEKIPGIGKDLAQKIEGIVRTGTLEQLEKLRKEVPPSLVELLSVPGLGPKTAKLIYDNLKIKSIDELEKMAKEHKLQNLPGIRAKTEENILKGIELLRAGRERRRLDQALLIARAFINVLKDVQGVEKISEAGSVRRRKETIKDIDILITSSNPEVVMEKFVSHPMVREVISKGSTRSSIRTKEFMQVDLRIVESDSFGSALAYFTGSKEHNIRLRDMAKGRGLKINEYGIFEESSGKKLGGREEEDIYRILELQYVPPEMREDKGEVEASKEKRIPKLVELNEIRGDFHVHSKWSDGGHTIEEIVKEAIKKGYEFIAITDHSKSLGVAKGLDEEKLARQSEEIERLRRKYPQIKILHGIELDIKSDGTLDFDDETLSKLDLVIAAIHTGFKQDKEIITKRIINAMENPHVHIIAHPSGRLIGERDPYNVDMEEILECASKTGTVLEINAFPQRLDLRDIYCKRAKEMGVKVAIGTDAHTISQLEYMEFGVWVARRGWLERSDVLNTFSWEEIKNILIKNYH
ncbi:MAG: DNA polymerase/3'-5' exonuclease PolX [Candidatus Aminicenantia bacterium]